MLRRVWLAAVAAAFIVLGCGSGQATPAASQAPAASAGSSGSASGAPAASLAAGSIGYVVVNEWTGPVDVYLRSQGVVQAVKAVSSLAVGAVTDQLFPPDPGEVVVLPAGQGDPTCVSSCSFAASSSTNTGEGNYRILLVRGDASTELWANASVLSVGKVANALPPADPSRPMLIAEAGGVSDAKFGLSLAWNGAKGCATPLNARGQVLGGTNVLAYDMARTGGRLTVFLGTDNSCVAQSQGGPFSIPATAKGSRTLLLIWGTMGAMQANTVKLP